MYLIVLLILLTGFLFIKKQSVESFKNMKIVGRSKEQIGRGCSPYNYKTKVVDIHCGPDLDNKEVCYPAKAGGIQEGSLNSQLYSEEVAETTNNRKCKPYHVTNPVYYPRYKFWWKYVKDLKTRPEYNQIFPPFWNTHYDPNITSDEYYERVASDNIMPEGRHADQIKLAHDRNFMLRQDIKFANR